MDTNQAWRDIERAERASGLPLIERERDILRAALQRIAVGTMSAQEAFTVAVNALEATRG